MEELWQLNELLRIKCLDSCQVHWKSSINISCDDDDDNDNDDEERWCSHAVAECIQPRKLFIEQINQIYMSKAFEMWKHFDPAVLLSEISSMEKKNLNKYIKSTHKDQ